MPYVGHVSKEAWTLSVALAVAVITAATQMAVARRNRTHTTAERIREVRRDIYTTWMQWMSDCYSKARQIRNAMDDGDPPGIIRNLNEEYTDHRRRGPGIEAGLRLVAPKDTWHAVMNARTNMLYYFSRLIAGDDEDHPDVKMAEDVADVAEQRFIDRAQRDIGVWDDKDYPVNVHLWQAQDEANEEQSG